MRYRNSEYSKPDYADDLENARNLLENGVPSEQVRKIFKNRIDTVDLDELLGERRGHHEQSRGVQVQPDIKRLVDEMRAPDDFIDPLYQHLMEDPVVLSTGLVLDRSSIIGSSGQLRFTRCPFSGEEVRDDIYPVTSKREAIANFKARRDRNVNEIARKLIASGEYRSFVDILDAVESYVKGRGDNYLSLAREIAAVWTGVREASDMMLLVENLELDGTVNRWVPVVETGGLHDKVFKIIVSAEVFRSYAGRSGQNRVCLSLWDDAGMFVERCRLFDYSLQDRRIQNHNEMFGRRDPIVSKARPGFFYRLEYMIASGSSHLEVNGLICKIFAEASKRPSYRMRDANDEEGIYIGAVDREDSAHGMGLLEYDDGKRFVGKFYLGSMAEGVLYRGAHARRTLKGGQWTHATDDRLVKKYPSNMLVYDSTPESLQYKRRLYSGRSQYEESTAMDTDRAHAPASRYGSHHTRNHGVRGGTSRTGMLVNHHEAEVSDLDFSVQGSRYNRNEDEMSHYRRHNTSRNPKQGIDTADLPMHALPVFQSRNQHDQGDDYSSRAYDKPSRYKTTEDTFDEKRRKMLEKLEDDIEFEKEVQDRRTHGDLSSLDRRRHESVKSHHSRMKYADEHGNGKARSYDQPYEYEDLGRSRSHDNSHASDTLLAKLSRQANDDQDDLDQLRRDLELMKHSERPRSADRPRSAGSNRPHAANHSGRPHHSSGGSLFDQLDAMRDEFDKIPDLNNEEAHVYPHREEFQEKRPGMTNPSAMRTSKKNSSLGIIHERSDASSRSHMKNKNSLGMIPSREEEHDGYDRRDAMNGSRNRDITPSSKRRIRPIVMMVDNLVTSTKGGTWRKILKTAALQDGVHSILVSADDFQDIEGISNLAITLYNARDQAMTRHDIFGNPSKKGMASQTLYRFMEREDNPIVSKASPGCYYQLEYSVGSGNSNSLTVRGLVCKINPQSNEAPTYEMCDPEGHKGRYIGALNIKGDAHGLGRLEYENGNTFVGQFEKGKLKEGAYYRGTHFMFSMARGQWTEAPVPALAKKYPNNVQIHTKLQSARKQNTQYTNVEESGVDSPMMCCFG